MVLNAQPLAAGAVARLVALTSDNRQQLQRVQRMRSLLDDEKADLLTLIDRRGHDAAGAVAMLQSQDWTLRFERVQAIARDMTAAEQQLAAMGNTAEGARAAESSLDRRWRSATRPVNSSCAAESRASDRPRRRCRLPLRRR